MIKQYIATGYYVHDCQNGLQLPLTGIAIYTGYFNQCDADINAYYLAMEQALIMREVDPCIGASTTTTTTTTTTTVAPQNTISSGNLIFNWSNDFRGDDNGYYDVVAWGDTNGYLSGVKYQTDHYFSYIDANDIGGAGVVLAIIHGSGKVTGFGNNFFGQLNFPYNLTGIKQVSIGYDHCLALKNDNTVTGWGRDYWNVLNIHTGISNVKKVCAGIGASIFLLESGIISGSTKIGGNSIDITYPTETGFINIDHCGTHILAVNRDGILTGIGSNGFGESNKIDISGIYKIHAGLSTSMFAYNDGYVSGYGTNQAIYNTPYIGNSGIDITLRGHIGTILTKDQDIIQWTTPWVAESGNVLKRPNYLKDNIVSIAQANNFTVAIYRRADNVIENIVTGKNYLWQVSYVGGVDSYGGISIGDIYPPLGTVLQTCDSYSFVLPDISGIGQSFTGLNVSNCSTYGGTHNIIFNSIYPSTRLINIDYGKSGQPDKTGFAATGITTGDIWNRYFYTDTTGKTILYSNGEISYISGGNINIGSGSGISFTHNDNMYATAISGLSYPFGVSYTRFQTGNYLCYIYAHGQTNKQNSYISVALNGAFILYNSGTTTGVGYNNLPFTGNIHYIPVSYTIYNTGDVVRIYTSGFLNGIQFIKV